MPEKRWLLGLGPPVVALVALVLLAGQAGAVGPARDWPRCGPRAGSLTAAATAQPLAGVEQAASSIRYGLDPQLVDGELMGQRLRIAWGLRPPRVIDLPPESFAAGPFGRLVLVGADDGLASNLMAVDLLRACAHRLASDRAVIRRATMAPDGRAVYMFKVDRATRADLGVWRLATDGSETRVLDPVPDDPDFGPTFTTELSWSSEADRLVVQSCGAMACRARLLDTATGRITRLGGPDQGELIGVADGRLVYRSAACRGLPCAVLSIDLASSHRSIVSDEAGLTRVVGTADGFRIVHEVPAHAGVAVRVVTLSGGEPRILPMPAGLRLVSDATRASSATTAVQGGALVTPDGRVGFESASETYIRLDDGAAVRIPEGSR
jgi:hypothetical protein